MTEKILCLFACIVLLCQGCVVLDEVKPVKKPKRFLVAPEKIESSQIEHNPRDLGIFDYRLGEVGRQGETKPTILKGISFDEYIESDAAKKPNRTPSQVIDDANSNALVEPGSAIVKGAAIVYPFKNNAVFMIYTAVGRITDIEFQPGEVIEKVAGGDTLNWLFESCVVNATAHLIIKPVYTDLENNVIVLTNKRAYNLYLKSGHKTSMVSVKWYYPEEEKKRYQEYKKNKKRAGVNDLKINYTIDSKCEDCLQPVSLYEDYDEGKIYIKMPEAIRHYSLPVLFSLDDRNEPVVINYRYIKDEHTFVIDSLYTRLMLKYQGDEKRKIFIYKTGFRSKNKLRDFFDGMLFYNGHSLTGTTKQER